MRRVYEISYGPGYVRGTRKQVSRYLDGLDYDWFQERGHVHEVALGQAWARLAPSARAAWVDKAASFREQAPELPENATPLSAAWSQFGSVATLEWQAFIGDGPQRPALPWIVRADTDKARRCLRGCGSGGTQDEIERTGGVVTRWHVYACAWCGQRFARWPVPLLPEFETGRRVFWERLPSYLGRTAGHYTQHMREVSWEVRHNGWRYGLTRALPQAIRRDMAWVRLGIPWLASQWGRKHVREVNDD